MENTVSLAPGTPSGTLAATRVNVEVTGEPVGSALMLVTAQGEIDAANALVLSKFVEGQLDATSRLIVDLRPLNFFGTQGFSILHRINVMCSRHNVNWVIIAGAEVDRVLHICDPDGGLPVTETLEDAMAAVIRPPRSHLRLVSSD